MPLLHRLPENARWAVAASLLFCAAAGCGSPSEKKATSNKGEEDSVKTYTAAELPKLGDYLPPLDDGKIHIAPPGGWKVMNREAKYVARFYRDDQLGMPRILVTVEDSDFDGLDSVDKSNLAEFARQTAERIKKLPVLEPAKAMVIGEKAYVRYVLQGKFKGRLIERQMLQTISGGRLYTIDLQVDEGEIKEHRNDAYAVAAGVKISNGAAVAPPPVEPAPVEPSPVEPATP